MRRHNAAIVCLSIEEWTQFAGARDDATTDAVGRPRRRPRARRRVACCGPITAAGARLAAFLDGTGVDHLWLPGFKVNWETGAAISAWEDGRPHTHCSAFVASAAMRLGIYVLRPPEHSPTLLANAQMGWLGSPRPPPGAGSPCPMSPRRRPAPIWANLSSRPSKIQTLSKPGHIAIVRPSDIDTAALLAEGPFVIQAGGHNALSVPLARGLPTTRAPGSAAVAGALLRSRGGLGHPLTRA